MTFGYIGFNNFNMFTPFAYGGYYGCFSPFMSYGYCYNPFSVFNTAMQLMSAVLPSGSNTYGYNSYNYRPYNYNNNYNYNYSIPKINFGLADVNFNSLYDGMYPPKDYSKELLNSFGTITAPVYNRNSYQNLTTSSLYSFPVYSTGDIYKSSPVFEYKPSSVTLQGSHLNKEFLDKVKQVAKNLNCDYQDLLAVMNSESGLKPDKWNASKSAVGLIQFTNSALAEIKRIYGIELTKEQVSKMSALEQLDLAEKYLKITTKKFGGRKLTASDLYASLYLPARANSDVLARKGENYYDCNSGLDMNGDGVITKEDLEKRLSQKRVNLDTFA